MIGYFGHWNPLNVCVKRAKASSIENFEFVQCERQSSSRVGFYDWFWQIEFINCGSNLRNEFLLPVHVKQIIAIII